jgi:putative hemolysin
VGNEASLSWYECDDHQEEGFVKLDPDTLSLVPQARLPSQIVSLAQTPSEILEAQRLRYQVFAEELGANLANGVPGIDQDRFDRFCQHLIVRDTSTNQVIGCARLLTDKQAAVAGGFYSQTEFDIGRILALPGRFMELGRVCVHQEYRSGSVITLLWSAIARFLLMNKIDYIIGCASIPMRDGGAQVRSIYEALSRRYLSPAHIRAVPRVPLPKQDVAASDEYTLPPLLKAYIRLGAQICGEPSWDRDFDVADLFILLQPENIKRRYARHFLDRVG